MRLFLVVLLMVMLPLRGMAGASMQTAMGISQIQQIQMASADAQVTGMGEMSDPCTGCCEGCAACDVCHILVGQPASMTWVLPELTRLQLSIRSSSSISADLRTETKPPAFLS